MRHADVERADRVHRARVELRRGARVSGDAVILVLALSGCDGRAVPWLSGMAWTLLLVFAIIVAARMFASDRDPMDPPGGAA